MISLGFVSGFFLSEGLWPPAWIRQWGKITVSFKIKGHSSARHALSAKFLFSGQTCTAAGWGLVSEKGLASEELKEVRKTYNG